MTRVEKNKKVYKKNLLLRFLKEILKDSVILGVGIIYLIYSIVKWINNLVAKLFMAMPRILRVSLVYGLIGVAIYGNVFPKTIVKEVAKEEEYTITLKPEKKEEQVSVAEEKRDAVELSQEMCHLGEIECKIYNKSIEYGLNREQAFIVVSISRHETGKWTSKAFLEKHNLGGIMCSTGLRQYGSLDEGIDAFVSLLKNRYFDRGLDTIEKIQPVYCPIGASNDSKGLNQHWLPMVTKYYNEYMG